MMSMHHHEDECCTAGGKVPAGSLRRFEPRIQCDLNDELGLTIVRLLTLHPQICKFRQDDLSKMDDNTKRDVIADIHEAMKIKFVSA